MSPHFIDPATAAAAGEVRPEMVDQLHQLVDTGFKNLSVKDAVKELSTTVAAAYSFEDEYDYYMNGSDFYRPVSVRIETFVMSAVLGLIFIVGVVGNGTLVAIFLRHRGMRNIPNTYIFSLALADLLVIIICVPLAIMVYTTESSPMGSTLCRLTEFAKDISVGVSVFTLTALSGERYCAIVNPLRKLHTKPLTVFTAVMIWLLAIICALPVAIRSDEQSHMVGNNISIMVCSPFGPDSDPFTQVFRKYITVAKAVIYYFLPLSIIGILYALMARRLHLSAREMPGELPMQSQQARARRHVARMVVTFVIGEKVSREWRRMTRYYDNEVPFKRLLCFLAHSLLQLTFTLGTRFHFIDVFIICFLPYHIFMLWFHLYPDAEQEFDDFWHILRMVGICFSFLNSCANPVALYCVSGVFRQHFHWYLCCRPMVSSNRLMGHSTATNVCDTSFSSTMRRNTIKSHGGGSDHNTASNGNSIKCGAKINGSENSNSYWHQNSGGGVVDAAGDRKSASATQSIILMEKR